MNPVLRYITLLAAVSVTMIAVKGFFIDSCRIAGDRMGDTLKAGDCVLVNKRNGDENPGRNRIVLYRSPLRRDASHPPLFVGRCLGMPGDVIRMGVDWLLVNGRTLPQAPMMTPLFRIRKEIKEQLLTTMDSLRIPLRDVQEDTVSLILRLSLREKELLCRNLTQVVQMEQLDERAMGRYEFTVPQRGILINMNETSLIVCREAILNEAGSRAIIRDGKLYIDGKEQSHFFFRKDYYWILSENESDGIDSRHLGLIPDDHIIGNIWYCWYSNDASRRFKKIR